ncbi:ACP S-malonyltransferase [Candidatus Poribacteria bacterium]|nr:ACP S-malonyltransferase [Candidatus Poribacteria bacterium]
MGKTAWIFPGQGSQYVGMGRELCERFAEARIVFDQAEQSLGKDLRRIIFDGPEDTLKQTVYAQPAIFVVSVALIKVMEQMGLSPDYVAGHSLGEYSALVAAGAITFEDALALVSARATAMQRACEANGGAMCAVLGFDAQTLEEICAGVSDGVVDVANINSPGQVVISGERNAVKTAGDEAMRRGARRVIPLQVSGAFHSRLMRSAADEFEPYAMKTPLAAPAISFFPNVTASLTDDPAQIRNKLVEQIYNPVRWQLTVERMLEEGVATFIEVGPGKVLTGLLKRTNGSTVGLNVDGPDSVEALAQKS